MERDAFTLEKFKLNERVGSIEHKMVLLENKIDLLCERMDRHGQNYEKMFKQIIEHHEKMEHIVFGNGKVGLAEEVRNLKKFTNQIRFIWVAVAAWIGECILRFFFGKG